MLFVVRCSDEASPPPSLVAANKNFCQVQIRFSPPRPCAWPHPIHATTKKKCCVVAMPTQPQITKNAMPFLSRDSGLLWHKSLNFPEIINFLEDSWQNKNTFKTNFLPTISYPRVVGSNETGFRVQPSTSLHKSFLTVQSRPIKVRIFY